jgi:hypothetical protein
MTIEGVTVNATTMPAAINTALKHHSFVQDEEYWELGYDGISVELETTDDGTIGTITIYVDY